MATESTHQRIERALRDMAHRGERIYAVLEWGDQNHGIVLVDKIEPDSVLVRQTRAELKPNDAVVLHFGPCGDAPSWSASGVVAPSGRPSMHRIELGAIAAGSGEPCEPYDEPLCTIPPSVVLGVGDSSHSARMTRWFETLGRSTATAMDDSRCLQLIREAADELELVVIDGTFCNDVPGFLRKLRAVNVLVPILVTGLGSGPVCKDALHSGADEVLPCAIGRPRVRRLACRLMARARALRHDDVGRARAA